MKLKKHLICLSEVFIISLLLIPGYSYSQRFSAGIVGGVNASQIDGDQLAGFDKLGLTGGIKAIVNLESVFDLNVEFLFTQRGSKPDIFNPDVDPDIKVSLDYAEIPVYVSIGDWWQEEGEYHKVSAHAGVSFGRLISARTFDYFNPSDQSLDKLVPYFNNSDLSWLVGLSYRMSSKWGLTGRYTREITPLLSPEKHNLAIERLLSYYMTFRLEYYF
ncbi:MAG TPA: outer membrane beta-barrel protein [Saprospiraceae bacterium]|nr:outer membrane beta-barrel protein [Saprospiraceae bacterium]